MNSRSRAPKGVDELKTLMAIHLSELGFSRIRTATPLRFGSGFHVGLETHNRGATDQTVFECALADYEALPTDPLNTAETVVRASR